jgi:hypothetical protein
MHYAIIGSGRQPVAAARPIFEKSEFVPGVFKSAKTPGQY